MARTTNRLTAIGVRKISAKGRYADGGGPYLRVSPAINKSWVFRSIRDGNATEIGLRRYPDVSLADARKKAMKARQQVAAGLNPKYERKKEKAGRRTFGDVSDEYLQAMGGRWTSEKTRWQWKYTLTEFSAPIRNRAVADLDTDGILGHLKPIWNEKPGTAAKARMRLEAVLHYAKAKGWRDGENPARWRGHLSNILPPRQKLTRGHHPAMPYHDVPGFVERLQSSDAMTGRALEFLKHLRGTP